MTDQTADDILSGKSLQDAVEQLYVTFAAYPLDPNGGSDDARANALAAMTRAPLRKQDAGTVHAFASDALLEWNDLNAFKHALPRLLDLAIAESLSSAGGQLHHHVSEMLNRSHWRTWPQQEQQAVSAVYQTWAIAALSTQTFCFFDALRDAIELNIDMTPFLAAWEAIRSTPTAVFNVRRLIGMGDFRYCFAPSFYNPDKPYPSASATGKAGAAAWQQLLAWVLDPATENVLIRAYITGQAGSKRYKPSELDGIAAAADDFASLLKELRAAPR